MLIYEQKVIPITLLGISYSDSMFTQDMKSYHVKEQHKGRNRLLFKYAQILTEEANVLALIPFLYILPLSACCSLNELLIGSMCARLLLVDESERGVLHPHRGEAFPQQEAIQ